MGCTHDPSAGFVIDHAGRQAAATVSFNRDRSQCDDRNRFAVLAERALLGLVGENGPLGIESVHLWNLAVHQDQVISSGNGGGDSDDWGVTAKMPWEID